MKIALVYSFKESNWFSCTKIVKNLLASYELAFDKDKMIRINYNFEDSHFDIENAVEEIYFNKPDRLVFLDHRPQAVYLLNKLFIKYPHMSVEIDIHVYGDFTLNFNNWSLADKFLKDKHVKFFCASDAQVKILKKFLENSEKIVYKIPFPVEKKEFYVDESYIDIRKQFNLPKESKIAIYTGRLSKQKNIIELCEIFEEGIKRKLIPENYYLLLAGEFDNLGFRFGNVHHHLGEYYRSYSKHFEQLEERVKKRILYVGNIDNARLNDFYNSANIFISLSTYHDEDYGMSVAEAGASGLPLLLADWAGFKSFKHENQCELIKTSLSKELPLFDQEDALKKIEKIFNLKNLQRKSNSEIIIQNHSVESIAKMMKEISLKKVEPFQGFNSFLYNLGRVEKNSYHVFYDDMTKKLNKYYFEVYDVYAT